MQRVLVTGDFQADFQNLDLCQTAWNEILEICEKESVSTVVVAGDLKQVYNPVDARVIKWWFNAIKQAKDRSIGVMCNLGNHDRLGLYVSTENWFPILRKAGAQCFDRPTVVPVDGFYLAFLPYRNSAKLLRQDAEALAKQVEGLKAVLIFHGEISGAKYNQFGSKSENGIQESWLHADRYSYCIGGHIHLQQKISKNIYYCGSPFAQDWGEANQKKGYIITDGVSIQTVPSRIPGWFDPTWPGFYEPEVWTGTRVRVHVECRSALEYVSTVARARAQAGKRYPGAEINVSATFCRSKLEEVRIAINDPDEVKITEYVRQTCPENVEPNKVIKYLSSKIGQQTGRWQRTGTGVTFLKAKATNFLSFKELEVNWKQDGIVVVQGMNKDRMGKSNGSGKTSLLQTIPVALFGTTFKGQKHDRWAKRGCEDSANVTLFLRDGKNRLIKISRSRKPSKLRLWVDGKEKSTGMKPQDKDGTQGMVEKLTGFTWQTLANAVYIDQDVAYQFVAGTKKSRTDVLSKIQNLERFSKALEIVKKDRVATEAWAQQVEESLSVLLERIDGCKRNLTLLVEDSQQRLDDAWNELEQRKKARMDRWTRIQPEVEQLKRELRIAKETHSRRLYLANMEDTDLKAEMAKRAELVKQKLQGYTASCPTCWQSLSQKYLDALNDRINSRLATLGSVILKLQAAYAKRMVQVTTDEVKCETIGTKIAKLMDELKSQDIAILQVERSYRELKHREQNEGRRVEVRAELKAAIVQKKSLVNYRQQHLSDMEFYTYCEKALSRDGIPAFLNALLCAPLNAAAEYYAEIFADKSLQVRFELDEGEFIPVVLNATGGEAIEDQSDGEKALAGLIASFALRETAPSCNLLIMDEPGHGLDPSAARQFAKGLRGLLGKFNGLWLTTHNPVIASELVDQHVVNVVKQDGVSQVQL